MNNKIERFRSLARTYPDVLAACVLMLAFCIMRLCFAFGIRGFLLAFGLMVVDIGIVFHLHLRAETFREFCEDWRQRYEIRQQKERMVDTAKSALETIRNAHNKVSADIRQIESDLKIRQRLSNIDVPEMKRAIAAAALEGYLSGVDANRGLFGVGRSLS